MIVMLNKFLIFYNKFLKTKEKFLALLKNGPTISEKEASVWNNKIKQGYKSWTIETF